VNNNARRKAHFCIEEQLPDRFTRPSGIINRHEWISSSHDRVLDPSQSKLESFTSRVVEMTTPEENVTPPRSIWVKAVADSDEGSLVI
jgi:hypothetical protein